MKKIRLLFISIALVALTVTLQHCNKNYDGKALSTPKVNNNNNNDNSDAVVAHILAFKAKMKYYKENQGLKSNEKEQTDSTVLDWESTINLTYCYSYLELSDTKVFDTTIAMPPVSNDSILMTDISDKYYNEIVYAVQAQYFQAPFADSVKKLMAVDLEKTTGGDSLSIISLIGNTTTVMHPPYDWKYGEYGGTCDGQHDVGISDAAHVIADNTRNYFYEEPPAGCRWWFNNIETIDIKNPKEKDNNGNYIYRNPDDDPGFDNYKDFLIYYASSDIGPITDPVLCLEHYDELAFYKQSYIDLTQGWIDGSGGKKFKDCKYEGLKFSNTPAKYKHRLTTFLGKRWVECDINTDDIANY